MQGNIIYFSVDDYRAGLEGKEYPSQIISQENCLTSVMGLNKDATVSMLKWGDGDYELPTPPVADKTACSGFLPG